MDVVIVEAGSVSLREEAFALRRRVFVEEQGVPVELERDEHDDDAFHAVALSGGRVVGTGRLVLQPGRLGRIGRMAVEPSARGARVGEKLLAALEERARELRLAQVELHAQCYVEPFYARAGYTRAGEPFVEAGIDHVVMRKRL
jgi:predicted GNAT family N-acyltransferase